MQGHVDPDLSEKGLKQARALGRRLAQTHIDAAYASDLRRTIQTTQAILEGHGVNLVLTPELREMSYGEWEGMAYQEIRRLYADHFADMLSRRLDFAPSGGESMNQLINRVSSLLAGIQERHNIDETVLLVAHSGSLRAAIISLLNWPRESVWSLWLDTASMSMIELTPNNSALCLLNDTSHRAAPILVPG